MTNRRITLFFMLLWTAFRAGAEPPSADQLLRWIEELIYPPVYRAAMASAAAQWEYLAEHGEVRPADHH